MKTQIKNIAIAITMILSFFGEVNAQSDTCEIAILNDAKTTWVSGALANGLTSAQNYKKSSISGVGGDTIYLRLQNSDGNILDVNYWVLEDQNYPDPVPNDTIFNTNTVFCILPTDTTRTSGVRYVAYSNSSVELDQVIIAPKFFPSTVILSDGSKDDSKILTLADFKLHVNLNYSALNKVTCDSIYWYKKNSGNNEFELISKTLKTDSYSATENGKYCIKAKIAYLVKSSPIDSCYSVRWESSDTVTVSSIDTYVNNYTNNDEFRVYPIPTTDFLNISEESEYVIFSITGQEVLKGFGNKIDVTNLDKGVYIIKTNKGNKKFVVK